MGRGGYPRGRGGGGGKFGARGDFLPQLVMAGVVGCGGSTAAESRSMQRPTVESATKSCLCQSMIMYP